MKQYKLAVFIGRFQPFHIGHEATVRKALEVADEVLVLIGDTGGHRTIKDPWTIGQRDDMLRSCFSDDENDRITVLGQWDAPTDWDWIAKVHDSIRCCGVFNNNEVVLLGHNKDASSRYLTWFPEFDHIDTGNLLADSASPEHGAVDATEIRRLLFANRGIYAQGLLNPNVKNLIHQLAHDDQSLWNSWCEEYKFITEYKASWASAPFPPIFVTTDAVVVSGAHVLLIKRGRSPGKGLLALPGGFLDQEETLLAGAIRELKEETRIKLQDEVLERLLVGVDVHDRAGGVSFADRGRIITHAHVFQLNPSKPRPQVRGGDDAASADWYLIADIQADEMFSDHGKILQAALKHIN